MKTCIEGSHPHWPHAQAVIRIQPEFSSWLLSGYSLVGLPVSRMSLFDPPGSQSDQNEVLDMESSQSSSPFQKFVGAISTASVLFGLFITCAGLFFSWKGLETSSWSKAPGTVDISQLETQISRTSGQG